MDDLAIRTAVPDDAEALPGIYRYYAEEAAIVFEDAAPTPDEFRARRTR